MANVLYDFLPGATITPYVGAGVVGMDEKGLLVPTPDGVREPQNRRVEIVIQCATSALGSRCGKAKCHAT
jgi:hypothetical protein